MIIYKPVMKKTFKISLSVLVLMALISILYSSVISFDAQSATVLKTNTETQPKRIEPKKVQQVVRETDSKTEIPVVKVDDKPSVLSFEKTYVELPLYAADYYYGKHINAGIAANEINLVPVLKPGDRVSLISDNYLTITRDKGYIKPPGDFLYASGVCWTVSTYGYLMDEANKDFEAKYGMPLFVFERWDRLPHKDPYSTYGASNYGYGYTVSKVGGQVGADYRFTVNPELNKYPHLKNIRIDIVVEAPDNHSWGYSGESIGAYIVSNIDY
jgi:hypothetical protein